MQNSTQPGSRYMTESVGQIPTKSNQKFQETEHMRGDLIAGAALNTCKHEARELLRVRSFETSIRKFELAEQNFLHCLNNYAQRFSYWTTVRDSNGNIFYFDRSSGRSQWERPDELEVDIREGKKARDQTEPWMLCEFYHINYLQCERSSRMQKTGCKEEFERVRNCVRQKTKNIQQGRR